MTNPRRSTIRPHQQREGKLAALNTQLRQEIAARERAEMERMEMEQGLQEVRDRFESGFANAPIGMASRGNERRLAASQ